MSRKFSRLWARHWRWASVVALTLAALLGLQWFYTCVWSALSTKEVEHAKAFAELLTGALALAGLAVLIWRTRILDRQVDLVESGQVTERFTKAVEQLGDKRLAVQLGGIYSLERIGKDSENDRGTIVEVLCAFVRNAQVEPGSEDGDKSSLPPQYQAAVTVLTQSSRANGLQRMHHDLREANLGGADLIGASIFMADLSRADLSQADLSRARLGTAFLTEANLSEAILRGTDFSGANLREANLSRADLDQACLHGADLSRAKLRGARLKGADLTRIILEGGSKTGEIPFKS